jgi:magnesium-transporting ATPase (P-type)
MPATKFDVVSSVRTANVTPTTLPVSPNIGVPDEPLVVIAPTTTIRFLYKSRMCPASSTAALSAQYLIFSRSAHSSSCLGLARKRSEPGWFIKSVMTEVLIIVVMRTWKPFYKSKVSRTLLIAMIVVLMITLALPYSPLSEILGFRPLHSPRCWCWG